MRKRISILFFVVVASVFGAMGCGTESVTTPEVDTVAPAPVADISAGVVGNSVEVVWTAGSEADLAGYKVFRGVNGSPVSHVSTVTGTTYTDTAVESGSSYVYEIATVDDSGNEAAHVSAQVALGSRPVGTTRRGSFE